MGVPSEFLSKDFPSKPSPSSVPPVTMSPRHNVPCVPLHLGALDSSSGSGCWPRAHPGPHTQIVLWRAASAEPSEGGAEGPRGPLTGILCFRRPPLGPGLIHFHHLIILVPQENLAHPGMPLAGNSRNSKSERPQQRKRRGGSPVTGGPAPRTPAAPCSGED